MDLEFCIWLQFNRLVWSSWIMMKDGMRVMVVSDYEPEVWSLVVIPKW
jgi:hypothetical protein